MWSTVCLFYVCLQVMALWLWFWRKRYSNSAGQLLWPDLAKDRESITHVRNRPDSLQSYFTSLSEDQQLLTLIEDMISYEPADRSTAIELLQHEFFTSPIATSGNEKRTSPWEANPKQLNCSQLILLYDMYQKFKIYSSNMHSCLSSYSYSQFASLFTLNCTHLVVF